MIASASSTVIALSGDVDLDLDQQMSHVARQAAARNVPVIVDALQATFIDSSVMRLFVRLAIAERRHHRNVEVVGASPTIITAFQTAGLGRLMTFR